MNGLLLAPVLALAVLLLVYAVLRGQRRGQAHLVGRDAGQAAGDADILYFTATTCTVCHVAQRPALSRLRSRHPGVRIREVDVAAEPHVARAFRVMSLPTTIVLGEDGCITAVNVGFAADTLLSAQLAPGRRGAAAAGV